MIESAASLKQPDLGFSRSLGENLFIVSRSFLVQIPVSDKLEMWNEVRLIPRFFMLFFENPYIQQTIVKQWLPDCC